MGEVKELATKLPDIRNSRWAAELEDDNGGMWKVKRRDVPVSIPERIRELTRFRPPRATRGRGRGRIHLIGVMINVAAWKRAGRVQDRGYILDRTWLTCPSRVFLAHVYLPAKAWLMQPQWR